MEEHRQALEEMHNRRMRSQEGVGQERRDAPILHRVLQSMGADAHTVLQNFLSVVDEHTALGRWVLFRKNVELKMPMSLGGMLQIGPPMFTSRMAHVEGVVDTHELFAFVYTRYVLPITVDDPQTVTDYAVFAPQDESIAERVVACLIHLINAFQSPRQIPNCILGTLCMRLDTAGMMRVCLRYDLLEIHAPLETDRKQKAADLTMAMAADLITLQDARL